MFQTAHFASAPYHTPHFLYSGDQVPVEVEVIEYGAGDDYRRKYDNDDDQIILQVIKQFLKIKDG